MNTKEFGERVAALRKARGMTQSQLADQLNVSNKTISRWETGEGYPEITLLVPLAKSLGVTVDSLLCESDSASDAQNNTGNNRKEYRHREVPVVWPWHRMKSAKSSRIEKKNLFIRNSVLKNNLMQCGFYILATCILCSANHYSLYTTGNTDATGLQGYFTGKIFGFILLAFLLAGVLFLTAINMHILQRNPERKNECIGNVGISMLYLITICFGMKPVCGIWIKNSYLMKQYAKGSILHGFDWFQYNRKLFLAAGCLTIGLYLLYHLILFIRNHRILKKTTSDAPHSQMDNIKIFWSSLILFNKVGAAAILISILGMLLAAGLYLISFLLHMTGFKLELPMIYLMSLVIITNISTAAAKAGLLSAIVGLGAGLFDCCDRQYKASLVIAVINVIFIYVLPMLIVMLQLTNVINISTNTLEAVVPGLW